jgi:hypothetical protein
MKIIRSYNTLKYTNFMDKYPVYSLEIQKNDTHFKNVDEIIEHLTALIIKHPVAVFITTFDHFSHTSSIEDGKIGTGIKDAKNLLFCFGKQLPNPQILAVRPRSIGITELSDSFSIDTLEVPNPQLQEALVSWIHSIKKS